MYPMSAPIEEDLIRALYATDVGELSFSAVLRRGSIRLEHRRADGCHGQLKLLASHVRHETTPCKHQHERKCDPAKEDCDCHVNDLVHSERHPEPRGVGRV